MSYDDVQVEVDSDNGIRSTEQVDEQPPSDYFVIFQVFKSFDVSFSRCNFDEITNDSNYVNEYVNESDIRMI